VLKQQSPQCDDERNDAGTNTLASGAAAFLEDADEVFHLTV